MNSVSLHYLGNQVVVDHGELSDILVGLKQMIKLHTGDARMNTIDLHNRLMMVLLRLEAKEVKAA